MKIGENILEIFIHKINMLNKVINYIQGVNFLYMHSIK